MMRLAWMCRPGPELGSLLLRDRSRFRVRCDRLRPHPEHGISVGGHMLAMLRRLIESERVKDGRLRIIRVSLYQRFHRLFVGEPALRLIDLVGVLVVTL